MSVLSRSCNLLNRHWLSVTQQDQNEMDEEARKKAMDELVGSWMDRLQQMSIIVRT